MTALLIGTRKSPLAVWQAELVAELLGRHGMQTSLVPISTKGDQVQERALSQAGGKGLFVTELEDALRDGRADLAVHSAKDVPCEVPNGMELCAFPVREDPRDALVAPRAKTFDALPRGARVGTSSLRRVVQLLEARPDLEIVPIRGNIEARLRKAAELDGVVVALAGLRRLGLEGHATEILPAELSLPAPGQGALALEALSGSRGARAACLLDDSVVSRCVRAERAVQRRLEASCTVPLGAYAVPEEGGFWLRAVLGQHGTLLRAQARDRNPETLGRRVGEALLEQNHGATLAP